MSEEAKQWLYWHVKQAQAAQRSTKKILFDAINELWRIESEGEAAEEMRAKAAIARAKLAAFADLYLTTPDPESREQAAAAERSRVAES